MGLIRDSIRSAVGADQVKNGLGGPKLPFGNGNKSYPRPSRRSSSDSDEEYFDNRRDRYSQRSQQYAEPRYYPNDDREGSSSRRRRDDQFLEPTRLNTEYDTSYPEARARSARYQPRDRRPSPDMVQYTNAGYASFSGPTDQYGDYHRSGGSTPKRNSPDAQRRDEDFDQPPPYTQQREPRSRRFRVIAIPQVAYGDGQPYLRAYSDDLQPYGISEQDFIDIVDALNIASIPNPEVQIFQKGARIAGFFVPGAASLGLIAGQVGVGIASAVGHASMIGRVLSKANLNVFIPKGLEICVGKAMNVNAEIGIRDGSTGSMAGASPEDRLASYGNYIAPISVILPPVRTAKRNDPLAVIGRTIGQRDQQRKMGHAQDDLDKGKTEKSAKLEQGVKWLMVRKATPDALSHWQETLRESDAAIQEEQRRGGGHSSDRR